MISALGRQKQKVWFKGRPLIHSEFEASLSYIRPCLIINNQPTVVVY